MKKKLKINALKVQSFVTSVGGADIKGGTRSELCGSEICGTNASCYHYISCNELACVIHSKAEPCVMDDLRTALRYC